MLHILKLIRIQNLLIIVATQSFMRWLIIEPILQQLNFELQFSNLNFALLVVATVALTAAGYVINDYFDTKTDTVNRPETVIVGKQISRRQAMTLHVILNIVGILSGMYISWYIGLYQLGIIYIAITGILWYYSTTYKRQFLIGNVIVALLTALVPLMVVLYEIPTLNAEYQEVLIRQKIDFMNAFAWVAGFSFFAFITTLTREMIKDIEDFEGDCAYGRNTVPIVLGATNTKIIISILIAGTIAALITIFVLFLTGSVVTLWYFILGLILPLVVLSISIIRAKTKENYHFASNFIKVIMLIGLLYSFVFFYFSKYGVM